MNLSVFKLKAVLMSFLLILLCFSNCTKTTPQLAKSLVGGWKAFQGFQGWSDGGDFKWHVLPVASQFTYNFAAGGNFSANNITNNCMPAKYASTDSTLYIHYQCSRIDTLKIETISADSMVLTNKVIEGLSKIKFIKIHQ